MTPEDWIRLRRHFDVLCEHEPASWPAAIGGLDESPEICAQLQRMLQADVESRVHEHVSSQVPALHRLAGSGDGSIPDRSDEVLGAWRIVGTLGEGGMGQVYRARRDDGRFEAEAAIKIVTCGINAAQFIHERSVLARLQHPNIARLLDGGECADGRPYLVMELVCGTPIDRHCAGLDHDMAQTIRLLIDAAEAVAYAHARAVLHRDLKPDNIMVDEHGQVKLLDFGVAKLLDVENDGKLTVASCFTPRYAAPEQVAGEMATTATDVFSLAVVIYELLSQRHPFAMAGADGDLTRRMLTGEATPLRRNLGDAQIHPGPIGRRLRDLEAVLACALRSDPSQRYTDMYSFAAELGRVAADKPVRTRTPGLLEQLTRWSRRNRVAAMGVVLGVISLLLGSGLAFWQAHEAALQRDSALQEARRAERVAEFLSDVFRAPDPSRSRGEDISARELLDRSRERITVELADDPVLRQRLQSVMGDTYRSLGLLDEAEELLLQALQQAADDPSAELLITLGWLHAFQGRFEDSAMRLREAAQRAASVGDVAAQVDALGRLATPLLNLNDTEQAGRVIREALALARTTDSVNAEKLFGMRSMLANIAYTRGDLDQAQAQYEEMLKLRLAERGEIHTDVALAWSNLATVAFTRGDWTKAETLYRRAIDINKAYFGVDNAQIAAQTRSLALTLRRQDRLEESLETFRRAAEMSVAWNGAQHPGSISVRLESLELALLADEELPPELEMLVEPIAQSAPDSLAACRYAGLRSWLDAQPDATAIQTARDCLVRQQASEAQLAMAQFGVARALSGSGLPADEAWREALSQAESETLRDPLLQRTVRKQNELRLAADKRAGEQLR
ncbi:protein kinase domain-containing protein [Dokdonella sp.]|uniref:serine/threonine protein kinase n=1 Tax=Dokdonella sp. TaxID=2291710 RepID=UPI003C526701